MSMPWDFFRSPLEDAFRSGDPEGAYAPRPDPNVGRRNRRRQPGPGYVRFMAAQPSGQVDVLMDGPARVVQGGPIVEEMERRHRVSLTAVTGIEPIGLEIPVVFDGMGQGPRGAPHESIQHKVDALERMRTLRTNRRLPDVEIAGMLPYRDRVYWIADVDWGDSVRREEDRALVRQDATVTLLERTVGKLLVEPGRGSQGGTTKVRRGETSLGDVKRRLKRTRGWNVTALELARANALSVSARLKRGQTLRLPR